MESMSAFEFAMGVYGVSLVVTLVVWLVIVAIRWVSKGRARL
jgi:hypothetical protein